MALNSFLSFDHLRDSIMFIACALVSKTNDSHFVFDTDLWPGSVTLVFNVVKYRTEQDSECWNQKCLCGNSLILLLGSGSGHKHNGWLQAKYVKGIITNHKPFHRPNIGVQIVKYIVSFIDCFRFTAIKKVRNPINLIYCSETEWSKCCKLLNMVI